MAWSFDDELLRALSSSHEMVCQVDVFDSDGLRAVDVPIEAGTVNASLMSDVSRTGALTVSRKWIDQGLFDPMSDKVRIQTGVRGWPLIPIFTGRVQDNIIEDNGSASVPLADFGDDVVEAKFEKPWSVTQGHSVINQMRLLLTDVDPNFTLESLVTRDGMTPTIAWNDNRAQALDELAAGINAIWQANRNGGFILYPNPYNQDTLPTPVLTLTDGTGGTLTSFQEVRSRNEVYNSITLEVQRTDGGAPIRVVVRDERMYSPTRWGGKFGKRNRRISVQTPYDAEEARRVARRILSQSLALARSWRFSTPHFPLLDPGDVVVLQHLGDITAHVIESITYPLLAINETSFTSRELRRFNENVDDESSGYFLDYQTPQEPVPVEPPSALLVGMSAPSGAATTTVVTEYAPEYMRDFGSDTGDADTLTELNSRAGGKWTAAPTVVMHTSWKDDVNQLTTWLDGLNRNIYLTWYHEPMGDVVPATYRATCATMVGIINAHPNKAFVLGNGPVVTRYWLDENNGDPADWGYAGMTFYGIDSYSQEANGAYWTPQQMFEPAFNKVRTAFPDVNLMVPEYGLVRTSWDTDGTGRAAAITSHINWLRTQPDVLAVAYFNATGSIPGVPFAVGTPESEAWKAL